MTLKDLIMKVSFEELLPYLKEHEKEHLDNIYSFREAYDLLRSMKPASDYKGNINVEWSGGEFEGEEKWISVGPMHDCSWEEDLAKEVVVADDIHLNTTELAMRCLWEITYWGFSPAERQETWREKFGPKRLTNKYEVALDRLEESVWRHQTPRRLRCKGPNGERCTRMESPLKWFDDRKNRSKRKREYRQDRREEYLKKMAARENLVRMLTADGSSFKRNDVDFILNITYATRYDYTSVTQDTGSRLAYILESMTEYQQMDLSKFDSAIVFIRYSSNYPVNTVALEKFIDAVRKHLNFPEIMYGTEKKDNDDKDVKVTLLLIKRS